MLELETLSQGKKDQSLSRTTLDTSGCSGNKTACLPRGFQIWFAFPILIFSLLGACASRVFDHPLDPENTLGRLKFVEYFSTGSPQPAGLDFSRERLWVVDSLEGHLYRVLASSGAVEYKIPLALGNLFSVADDGAFIWLTQPGLGKILRLNPLTFEVMAEIRTVHADPRGLAYKDGILWVLDGSSRTLSRLDPAAASETVFFTPDLPDPQDLALRGNELWAIDGLSKRMVRLSEQGEIQESLPLPIEAIGIASDGEKFYFSERTGRLYVFTMAASP